MSDASHAPAAKSEGGSNALGYAIGIGFLVLAFANGSMPANTQFAIIIGIGFYIFFKSKEGK